MPIQTNTVIEHLRRAGLLPGAEQRTDGQLLDSFVSRREAAALETLVRRHGPMVWGVCRRLLHNFQDAEDAFQATFLVLLRKASSVAPRDMVGNWLYGVAVQTARKARATAAKLQARERQVVDMPEPAVKEPEHVGDLQAVLDHELSRLPDKYRAALVLCELEGKSRKEAARQLGVPEGTLAGRLTRGRTMLAKRLARQGLAVSGVTLAALLSPKAVSGAVPTSLLSSTIKAVTLLAGGSAAPADVIGVKVIALTEGVMKGMLLSKLKVVVAVIVFLAVCTGMSRWAYRTLAAQPEVTQTKPEKEPAKEKQPGVPANEANQVRVANVDVSPEQPVRLKVVFRVSGGVASPEGRKMAEAILRDVQNDISLDVLNAGPAVDPQAQIRITKDTPRKTVVKVVEALLAAGVLKISIGDSFKSDGTVNPVVPKENIEGRWLARQDNGEYERLEIQSDRLSWVFGQTKGNRGFESSIGFSYDLDPTKTPKELDLVALDGTLKGKVFPCIYMLDGDTLRICRSEPGEARPKQFEREKGSSQRLLVLKREKP